MITKKGNLLRMGLRVARPLVGRRAPARVAHGRLRTPVNMRWRAPRSPQLTRAAPSPAEAGIRPKFKSFWEEYKQQATSPLGLAFDGMDIFTGGSVGGVLAGNAGSVLGGRIGARAAKRFGKPWVKTVMENAGMIGGDLVTRSLGDQYIPLYRRGTPTQEW